MLSGLAAPRSSVSREQESAAVKGRETHTSQRLLCPVTSEAEAGAALFVLLQLGDGSERKG